MTPGLALVLVLATLAGLGMARILIRVLRDLGWLDDEGT